MATGGKRATLSLAVVLAVSAAVGAGYWWWTGPRARAEAKERLAIALADFERCVLGDDRVAAEEVPGRLRGLALAGELGAALPEEWPTSCGPHLTEAGAQLARLRDEEGLGGLHHHVVDDRPELLRAGLLSSTASADAIRQLLAAARSAPLPEVEPTIAAPDLPAPAAPIPTDRLSVLAEGDELFVQRDGAPGLVVQRGAEGGATTVTVCGAAAGASDLRCGPPRPHDGAVSFRVLPRAPDGPLLAFDRRGPAAASPTWDADTWEPIAVGLRVGFARGPLVHGVVLQEVGKPTFAAQLPAAGDASRQTLDPPFSNAQPVDALVGPRAAVVRWESPDKPRQTRLYRVDESGTYGEPTLLPEVGGLRALCPLEGGAALVRTAGSGRSAVAFVRDEGEPAHHEVSPEQRMAVRCLPDGVSFLSVGDAEGSAHRIRRIQCRLDGCAADEIVFEPPAIARGAAVVAQDLGDRVVLAMGGSTRPILALSAPLAELPDATARLVADALAFGGPPVAQLLLAAHRDGALLFMPGTDGVRAVVIGSDGAPRPAEVQSAPASDDAR